MADNRPPTCGESEEHRRREQGVGGGAEVRGVEERVRHGAEHQAPLRAEDLNRAAHSNHGRMARGGHGLPKVSSGPTMPDPSTPCGQAIPELNLRPFQGWPARSAIGQCPSSTPLDTPRRTPMLATFRVTLFTLV
jgi:hypothetical protein